MTVIRRTPPNRLGKLMSKPGGPTVAEALAGAQKNLDSLQEDCLRDMDEKLAAIAAAVVRCRGQASDAELTTLYSLGNDVLEVAGVFDMRELGQAALSLCDLIDRLRSLNRWNQPALEVHVNGLVALRTLGGKHDAAAEEVLSGLRAVVDRVTRGEAAA